MQNQNLIEQAAEALRAFALNEEAKERFCTDPLLQPFMQRVAQRYVAGSTVDDVLRRVAEMAARGHRASAEYMGESVHDEGFANSETEVFLQLAGALARQGADCSISFDLSHVGAAVDPELGYRNALRIARAAEGREVMVSMENHERADLIYDIYRRLHEEAGMHHVGITVPARRHRSEQDLPAMMKLPGRIRLVKGAFHEGPEVSHPRNSPELAAAYRRHAQTLLRSGHLCSIATHDRAIQGELAEMIRNEGLDPARYEFESLDGLGTEQIDGLRAQGFPTREYAVFGTEHFLYVLNRISEEPVRVYQALIDLLRP
ncbi:proline dehydrogenase family protein [Massilia endophytica]|uniref:proline dehydrogenase family protein n=1 Tax=Massilia endophytica TaxID=2899220 RepID=UPI001E362779|nr:proline dehydrogenase family protein [Massilia endophytica]UGQ46269.1 proline dehydrogenase family protein [Massilia endophytica]